MNGNMRVVQAVLPYFAEEIMSLAIVIPQALVSLNQLGGVNGFFPVENLITLFKGFKLTGTIITAPMPLVFLWRCSMTG